LIHEFIIIGAGQAGIAMSQKLKKENISHLVVDNNEKIGASWRTRYNSLVLFTPRNYSSLPGLPMAGHPEGYPTKDEMANYLEKYVNHFQLPISLGVKVFKLEKEQNQFLLHTSKGLFKSRNVIVATGAFQKPFIPISHDRDEIQQIHSSSYKDPIDINGHNVLVVGGGNSGAQIATELAKTKNVAISVSHELKFLPLQKFGRSIFYWLDRLHLLHAGIDTKRGRIFKKRKDPIFGYDLKKLIQKDSIKIRPRLEKISGKKVLFSDGSSLVVDSIIWSTGFKPSYEWINIDGAISQDGKPNHNRGISPIENLYFIGLPWQYHRGSALVCGVGKDAEYLLHNIIN
jgi:putative flavoprotein involved in K+ transport